MDMSFEYWFLFPISVLIATIAMASGIEGATFFTPLFIIGIVTSAEGETFFYIVANRTEGQLLSGIGALFLGMISTGLGEMNGYFLIQRYRLSSKVAVATSVFIVAITALTASISHVVQFTQAGGEALSTILNLVMFTAPGVLIGAQLGSLAASRLSQTFLERSMGVLFILVGAIVLGETILQNQ